MKNNKLLFFILGLGIFLFPSITNALTFEEANKIMDSLPIVEEDGSCVFSSNSVSYEVMKESTCGFTYDEYVKRHPYKSTYTKEQLEESYQTNIERCKNNFTNRMFNHISKDAYFTYDEDTKLLNISINYDDGNLSKSCSIEYVEYDEEVLTTAKEVDNKLDYSYTLYGYDVINSFYHYGTTMNDIFSSNTVMYRFPKIKEVLTEYPYFDYSASAGGSSGGFYSQSSGFIKLFKDDILYGMHYFDANYFGILLVDKEEEGTTLEKAKRALNTYFGGKVEYSFDEDNVYGIDDSGYDLANKAFGTTGIVYEGIDVMLTLPSGQFNIGVAEMDKEDIKEFEVKAKHKGTGVYVSSNSYDVPVDSALEVEDVTKEVEKIFNKNMYKVHSAYDMEVVKMKDGGFVKTIENGIDVYLPISNRKVGEEMTVYHIIDNEKGEGFKGVVVDIDGKQYVKFTTTHFSTYAVIETLSEEIPNTIDNLTNSIICLLISGIILGGCLFIRTNYSGKEY